MKSLLIASLLTIVTTAQAQMDADRTRPGGSINDRYKPTVTLEMNDTKNLGPIIWYENGVAPPPDLPEGYTYVGPDTLGCDGTYSEAGWDPGWSARFPGTNFFSRYVQDRTYFFRNLRTDNSYEGFRPFRFTLRAHDFGGIKRIRVRVVERDVQVSWWNPYYVIDPGPTEFVDVSSFSAVAMLTPLYQPGGDFSHWEEQLTYEPTLSGSFPHMDDVVLRFSLTDFGYFGKVDVEVEDLAGNMRTGSVYLADDRLCRS